jgi:hypothetical protein
VNLFIRKLKDGGGGQLWETSQQSTQVVRKLMCANITMVLKDEIEINLMMVYRRGLTFHPFSRKKGWNSQKLITINTKVPDSSRKLKTFDVDKFLGCHYLNSTAMLDNCTNLRSTEKELKNALKELDSNKVQQMLTTNNFSWHFHPPAPPYFSGC